MNNPGSEWLTKFQSFTCPAQGKVAAPVKDVKAQPLLTCDENGTKYLLSAAVIEGTQLKDASSGIPQGQVGYVVDLSFDSTARQSFADVTQQLAGTGQQFAIVLDGEVISAPQVNQPIPGGNAQISGDFTQEEAQTLANSLKYGALPLKFTAPVVTEEGPSLASDQLAAGIWAGLVGLALVLVYCLIYYRGLGLVVFASLMVAAAVTYATVLVMSEAVGFTLTLPGIAGLIVAVGITADSFIVYFERIRDEMRDGKSMRVAVEAGWVRARATCLAADAVSLARRRGALHLRHRCREGLRVRAGHQHDHRHRGLLLLHQADGVVAGPVPFTSTTGTSCPGWMRRTSGWTAPGVRRTRTAGGNA